MAWLTRTSWWRSNALTSALLHPWKHLLGYSKWCSTPLAVLEQLFGYNSTNNEHAVNYWCLINEIIIITNCLIQCLHHTLCDSMISSQMCDPNLQGWQQLLPDYHRLWQAETKGGSPLLLSGIEQNLYSHRCREMSENMGAGTFLLLALFVWASAINVAINNVMCHNPVLHTLQLKTEYWKVKARLRVMNLQNVKDCSSKAFRYH